MVARRTALAALLVLACIGAPCLAGEGAMWTEVDGVVFGARADERGAIGGGEGYTAPVAGGDYTARDLDGLLDALVRAKAGEVVFVPGETEIDLTARIYIEQLVLDVPEGVTLAGERGRNGSKGALLTSDALKTPVMIRAAGPGVRITGLRIRGPNTKRYMAHHRRSFGKGGDGREYYYKLPTSNGIQTDHPRLEVDNCDISGFAHAGVNLRKGDGHHVHHNAIHHCQYNGLGYGVCLNTASALIECNLFNWNRHSIAGTSIEICSNTFLAPQTPIVIRGVPQEKCEVHHNWFPRHPSAAKAFRGPDEAKVEGNLYAAGAGHE